MQLPDHEPWTLTQRPDGAILVRMHSRDASGDALPDAVFTFRAGDPQYELWEARFYDRVGQEF